MDYKKILNTYLSHKGCKSVAQKSDPTMPIVALIAGLAIGAALSILFAPKKGSETRAMISDGADELSDNIMQKFQDAKTKLLRAKDASATKNQAVKNIRNTAKKASDQLTGAKNQAVDSAANKISTS